MTPQVTAFIVVVALYIGATMFLGWLAERRSSPGSFEDYAIASRSLGVIAQGLSFSATYFSAFAFLGVVSMNYNHGMAYWTISPLTTALTAIVGWLVGRRVWRLGKRYGYISLGDLVGDYYQSDLIRLLVALVGVIFVVPYIGTQMTAAGYVFNVVTDGMFPVETGAFAFLILTIVYVVVGGLRAVAWTDVMQGTGMYIGMLIAIVLIVWRGYGGIAAVASAAAAQMPQMLTLPGASNFITPMIFFGLYIPVGIGLLMAPQMFLRFYTAKSESTLKWSMFISGVFLATYHFLTPYVGIMARLLGVEVTNSDTLMPTLLYQYAPPVLAAVIMVGALMAMISTVDSQMHALSMVLTHDITRKYVIPKIMKKSLSDNTYFKLGRWFILVGALVSFWAALTIKGFMVIITTLAGGGFLQLLPCVLAALFWRRSTAAGVTSGLVVGTVLCSLWTLKVVPCLGGSTMAGIWGVLVNMALVVIVSLVTTPPPAEVVAKFRNV